MERQQSIHLGLPLATSGGGLIRRAALYIGATRWVPPFPSRSLRPDAKSFNPAEAGYQDLQHCHRVLRTLQPLHTLPKEN